MGYGLWNIPFSDNGHTLCSNWFQPMFQLLLKVSYLLQLYVSYLLIVLQSKRLPWLPCRLLQWP